MTPQTDSLVSGWDALGRAEWAQARDLFAVAAGRDNAPEAWEGVSRALWWLGDEAIFDAREQAYRGYRQAGDLGGAARMAFWLASDHLDFRGDDALASAWLRRSRAHCADLPRCVEQGYVALLDADIALLAHADPQRAQALAREALALAGELGDRDIEVIAHALLGAALVTDGHATEGLEHLDDAAALAVSEEFADPASPAWALCHLASFSAAVGEFGRAEQWCRQLQTLCAEWRARQFFGICRTAYGGMLVARGDWSTACEELESAMSDTRATRPALVGPAAVRLGELRRRQGDPAAARALFEQALPLPDAVVALGALDLQEGDTRAALDAAERILRRLGGGGALDRFAALELLALARAAAGDADGAAQAVGELVDDAAGLATPYMRGRAAAARASVLLARGDHDGARRAAEDAIDYFAVTAAPYEGAQARLVLGDALTALGRLDAAGAECRAAGEALTALGSRPPARSGADALSPREAEILRQVAAGLSDAQIAERLFLSPHTVHRHVANVRTKLRAPSRAAAVAHAARHGLL